MNIIKWLIVIITLAVIVSILFNLELWAGEWKDLFFYMDNWLLWIGLIIFVIVAKKIATWILQTEIRVMK
jgi:hypothetical protein